MSCDYELVTQTSIISQLNHWDSISYFVNYLIFIIEAQLWTPYAHHMCFSVTFNRFAFFVRHLCLKLFSGLMVLYSCQRSQRDRFLNDEEDVIGCSRASPSTCDLKNSVDSSEHTPTWIKHTLKCWKSAVYSGARGLRALSIARLCSINQVREEPVYSICLCVRKCVCCPAWRMFIHPILTMRFLWNTFIKVSWSSNLTIYKQQS